MTDEELTMRIVSNPNVMVGKPVIRGTRLTVGYIVGLLASGETVAGILAEYDYITGTDVGARWAARR